MSGVLNEKKMLNNKFKKTENVRGVGTSPVRKIKKIKVGDICILKISALGGGTGHSQKGIGIDEYTYGYSIFIPNSKLGETIKAKIVKINLKNAQYAIGQSLEVIKKSTQSSNLTIQPDQVLTVNIEKLGNGSSKTAGIVNLNDGYKLIIPNAIISNNVEVIVTRVKSKYACARLMTPAHEGTTLSSSNTGVKNTLLEGSKYSLNLPKIGKYYGKYVIVKLENSIVFIKFSYKGQQILLGN